LNEKVAVYISRKLYERVKKEVEESGGEFKDVSEVKSLRIHVTRRAAHGIYCLDKNFNYI